MIVKTQLKEVLISGVCSGGVSTENAVQPEAKGAKIKDFLLSFLAAALAVTMFLISLQSNGKDKSTNCNNIQAQEQKRIAPAFIQRLIRSRSKTSKE